MPARARVSSQKPLPVAPFLIIALLVIAGGAFFLAAGPTGSSTSAIDFVVEPGSGLNRVALDLEKAGLLNSPQAFKAYMRMSGKGGQIKAGTYELHAGLSLFEIGDILASGKVKLIALTIPEGWNNRQIGDYLAEKKLVQSRDHFLKLAANQELLAAHKIPASSTEGYLFPETYHVPPGYSALKLQQLMIRNFFSALAKSGAPSGLKPEPLHERLILASIVEREAVRPQERPMMAQVFINRLQKKMRLESCATIQYLLEKPRQKLYEKDLKIESPYNTYMNKGLPPGPVSNPGLPALKAAFAPAENPYLYFVLKPDGSHHFSKTYEEHREAKKKYLGS